MALQILKLSHSSYPINSGAIMRWSSLSLASTGASLELIKYADRRRNLVRTGLLDLNVLGRNTTDHHSPVWAFDVETSGDFRILLIYKSSSYAISSGVSTEHENPPTQGYSPVAWHLTEHRDCFPTIRHFWSSA
jgi:hypothetical protein